MKIHIRKHVFLFIVRMISPNSKPSCRMETHRTCTYICVIVESTTPYDRAFIYRCHITHMRRV
jgi:hypothetical protein